MTLHLTLKMTTAQVVETSVPNNSLSKDYPHLEDHAKPITDTPGFKPFTIHRIHKDGGCAEEVWGELSVAWS